MGSSGPGVATAATIGTVALGEVEKRGYSERLFRYVPIDRLDREASKLNVSRQAVIKIHPVGLERRS